MYTRQVETRADAEREMEERRLQGHKVIGPVQVTSPNGRPIWAYQCSVFASVSSVVPDGNGGWAVIRD